MRFEDKNEVKIELESISPLLASLPKKEVLGIPDGYFEILEEQLLSQMNLVSFEEQSLQEVPDGYFAGIETDLIKKIAIEPQDQPKIIKMKPRIQWKIALVASLVLLFGVLFVFNNKEQKSDVSAAEMAESEYFQYLENNIDEYSLSMLIDQGLLEESDLVFDLSGSKLKLSEEAENQLLDTIFDF